MGKAPVLILTVLGIHQDSYLILMNTFHLCTEEKDKKKLTINIKNPIFVGDEEGEKIILYFDSALEILDAVRKVYGANKCQVGDEISFSCLFFFVSKENNNV